MKIIYDPVSDDYTIIADPTELQVLHKAMQDGNPYSDLPLMAAVSKHVTSVLSTMVNDLVRRYGEGKLRR